MRIEAETLRDLEDSVEPIATEPEQKGSAGAVAESPAPAPKLEGYISCGESGRLGLCDSHRLDLRPADEDSRCVGLPDDRGYERYWRSDVVGAQTARKYRVSDQARRSQTGEMGDRCDLPARRIDAGGGHLDDSDSGWRLVVTLSP